MEKQNILLIVNPVSGRKKVKKFLHKLMDSLSRNQYETTIFTTTRKGEATTLVKEHAAAAQKIICCGGDGTFNEIVTGLMLANSQIPVGYIPTGTTNDLARALQLPLQAQKAIHTAMNGQIKPHDVGSLNGDQYFSYVASFGAFTKVAYSTPQWLKNWIGHTAYVFNGILSIADIHSHTMTIAADGKEIEGDFIFGSISNSTVIAGLIKLPKEDVCFHDGKFEVLLIKTPKNRKELRAITSGLRHQQYDERYVHYLRASEISLRFQKSTAWTIDGEYAGTHHNVCIRNIYQAIQVVVPAND